MNRLLLQRFSLFAVAVCVVHLGVQPVHSFVRIGFSPRSTKSSLYNSASAESRNDELLAQKKKLLSLIGPKIFNDPILADPITKEGVQIRSSKGTSFEIKSPSSTYRGSADKYLNLLEPVSEDSESKNVDASP